jgi:hypothetical protein
LKIEFCKEKTADVDALLAILVQKETDVSGIDSSAIWTKERKFYLLKRCS